MKRLRYTIAGNLIALALRVMPRGEYRLEIEWKK